MFPAKVILAFTLVVNLESVVGIGVNNDGYFDVAAFNVQIFGVNKMKNEVNREKLVDIILRYDLMLMQEIRDSSGEAIVELMKLVNDKDARYAYVLSERLGRSSSKEQYAFIYRNDWVTPVAEFVYDDVNEKFEREPYIVHFQSKIASIKDFIAIGIHTKPEDADNEISELATVYDHATNQLKQTNAILLGDFNAGCDYVKSFENIKLATDHRFYWLTTDVIDTTTKGTDCAYDRIVLAGEDMLKGFVPGSTSVFHYDLEYGLTKEQTLDISDHYPVQVQFFSTILKRNTAVEPDVAISDKNVDAALAGNYREIYRMKGKASDKGFTVESLYTTSGSYAEIDISKVTSGMKGVSILLEDMQQTFTSLFSVSQLYRAQKWLVATNPLSWLPQSFGKYQTYHDYYKTLPQSDYKVKISCNLVTKATPRCKLIVARM